MAKIRYVAFLRGINVSGYKIIKMEDLNQMFTLAGLSHVRTYIQSGNVLFTTTQNDETKLIKKLEGHLETQLGYPVSVILRTVDAIRTAIAQNPYPPESLAPGDERRLSVTFLQQLPAPDKIATLPIQSGSDELKVSDREIYILYRAYGDSKLTNSLIEKKLGVKATTRNWATVNKIVNL